MGNAGGDQGQGPDVMKVYWNLPDARRGDQGWLVLHGRYRVVDLDGYYTSSTAKERHLI